MDETQITEGERSSNFLVGLLCGAAVGAALGLLFAPKTGSEMRKTIADTAGRLRRRAADAYDTTAATIEDGVGEMSHLGEEAAADVVSRGQRSMRRPASTAEHRRGSASESSVS